MNRPAYYTKMDLYEGVSEVAVIKRAQVLGYELVKFDGWDDSDIGYPGNPGPHFEQSKMNRVILNEISDSFLKLNHDNTYDCIVISATR